MPRRQTPRDCGCGCGGKTKGGDFLPGHDQRLLTRIAKAAGGIEALQALVERETGGKVS